MHQSTTPSLSQTIWPIWPSRQFLSLSIVQTLLPVTFGYTLSSHAVIMRQLRDERGCDEGHWHAHTGRLPWGLAEVVGTVEEVHCSWRRLLRRGLKFYMCTINKTTHTKKVWKLINNPRIYIYIYILYIYIYIYIRVCVCVWVREKGKWIRHMFKR